MPPARAARLRLVRPAYAPALPSIEQACSQIKAHLRRLAARTREALLDALAIALDTMTPEDAQGAARPDARSSPNPPAHRSKVYTIPPRSSNWKRLEAIWSYRVKIRSLADAPFPFAGNFIGDVNRLPCVSQSSASLSEIGQKVGLVLAGSYCHAWLNVPECDTIRCCRSNSKLNY